MVIKNSLKGVHPGGKDIIVSKEQIVEALSTFMKTEHELELGIFILVIIEQDRPVVISNTKQSDSASNCESH